jgi:tRNA modification GTPase
MGGVAVIQVVGPSAPAVVSPFVRCKHPIDLENLPPNQIRLCQWADGNQVIDDALIAVRRDGTGEFVIELSLHGGPRIVQRSLLMLQRVGAKIVEPHDLLAQSCPAASALEQELLPLLLEAKTRAVTIWLAEMAGRLDGRVRGILSLLADGKIDLARENLAALSSAAVPAGRLIRGVRVVVVGGPNVGKSTLINSLAVREQAIVSDLPGTTRDWVEHPAAIDGAPFTFVDTAGIRETQDPIEQEAVRRTHQQASTADILLSVLDLSAPLESSPTVASHHPDTPAADSLTCLALVVANKSDLPPHVSWRAVLDRGTVPLCISAARMTGLGDLRARLILMAGLTAWRQSLVAPLTERQQDTCRAALSALDAGVEGTAVARLRNLLDPVSCG